MKKTRGDATYALLVEVIGRGKPDRLRQVMVKMSQEMQGVLGGDERSKESKSCDSEKRLEDVKHFEAEERFEDSERFEAEKHFEAAECFETVGCPEKNGLSQSQDGEDSHDTVQSVGEVKRQKWTKVDLMQFLYQKYQELGRIPAQKEVQEWSKAKLCPSYETWRKLFDYRPKTEWEEMLLGGHEWY